VVNLEIPWTPLRLEQRVGRVDRLGQLRRVHAICLVASGTREAAMRDRLGARSERIAAAFEHPAAMYPSLAAESIAEAARLATSRALAAAARPVTGGGPPLTVVAPGPSNRSSLWAFRFPYATSEGETVFETVAGVCDPQGRTFVAGDVADAAVIHQAWALRELLASMEPWLALARRRERAIASALRQRHARLSAGLLQPGLFDHRAERAASAQTTLVESALGASNGRLAWLDRVGRLRADGPSVAFGVAYR